MQKNKFKRGFTLVELATVLVVIGLIVGGLYVGKQLVRLAEARSTIVRLDQFDAALNAFRTKYKYLPGDLPYQLARGYGLPAGPSAAQGGDGSGRIDDRHTSAFDAATFRWEGELPLVWQQLSAEQAVPGGPFDGSAELGRGFPKLPIGGGVIIEGRVFDRTGMTAAGGDSHVNGYLVGGVNINTSSNEYTFLPFFQADAAYAVDVKRDDGKPLQGDLRVAPIILGFGACPVGNGFCEFVALLMKLILNAFGTTMFINTENTIANQMPGLFTIIQNYLGDSGIEIESLADLSTYACVDVNGLNAAGTAVDEEELRNASWMVGNDKSLCSFTSVMSGK